MRCVWWHFVTVATHANHFIFTGVSLKAAHFIAHNGPKIAKIGLKIAATASQVAGKVRLTDFVKRIESVLTVRCPGRAVYAWHGSTCRQGHDRSE